MWLELFFFGVQKLETIFYKPPVQSRMTTKNKEFWLRNLVVLSRKFKLVYSKNLCISGWENGTIISKFEEIEIVNILWNIVKIY